MKYAILLSILTLSACAGAVEGPVRVETVRETPPSALLSCRVAPPAPRGDAYTQADVARYIIRLSAAGEDCRAKLSAVRKWSEDTQ